MSVTDRFTGRANQYVKYRPSYSTEVIQHIMTTAKLTNESVIADIGAGTGIFSQKLLESQVPTIAVEPNEEMRHALLIELQLYLTKTKSLLTVKNGSAECTTLADQSVDHITCAQAYHWFDPALARAEFIRIMKPGGFVFLLWNQRDSHASSFVQDYEQLFLKYGKQYKEVGHKHVSQQLLKPFYGGQEPQLASFYNDQVLDYEGLIGRIQSSSFSLTEDDSRYASFMSEIQELYSKHQQDGYVKMVYRTDVYWGQML